MWLMSWPDGVRYSCPLQSLVVSLLSLVSTLVYSNWRCTVSSKFFDTQVPSISLVVSSLVFAATDTAFCYALISLGLAESRILPAAPVDTRPRTPLISFCTVQLRTICAAHSLASLCLFTTSCPDPGELPGFWGFMVFCHAPIPRKGSGNQQQGFEDWYRISTRRNNQCDEMATRVSGKELTSRTKNRRQPGVGDILL